MLGFYMTAFQVAAFRPYPHLYLCFYYVETNTHIPILYIGTCWVDTWLTSAEQRAGPPITEQKACGLAPLVRVSAAPCPPSQKQGNGLCYSSLLTLQQIWGLVCSHPLPSLSFQFFFYCFSFLLHHLMCVRYLN